MRQNGLGGESPAPVTFRCSEYRVQESDESTKNFQNVSNFNNRYSKYCISGIQDSPSEASTKKQLVSPAIIQISVKIGEDGQSVTQSIKDSVQSDKKEVFSFSKTPKFGKAR